jgi:acyl dehydratase
VTGRLLTPPEASVFGPVTRTDIVRYQGAAGDMQPIHHDEEYARAAGFPTVFSVGMFQAGLLASWAADWLGPENVRSYRARFNEQVWPGDVLTCSGVVARETGGVAIQAWATFVVPGHRLSPLDGGHG